MRHITAPVVQAGNIGRAVEKGHVGVLDFGGGQGHGVHSEKKKPDKARQRQSAWAHPQMILIVFIILMVRGEVRKRRWVRLTRASR